MAEQQKQESLAEGARTGIAWADFIGRPADLILKQFKTEGFRRHGLGTFFSAFVPAVVCQGEYAEAGIVATTVLVVLFFVRKALSRANKNILHSLEVGRSYFCRGPRPLVDLILGFAIAWCLHQLGQYPLASLMVISTFASAISTKALLAKQDMEVVLANDQARRGEYLSRHIN